MQVDLFTTAMRAEFVAGYNPPESATPSWQRFTTILDSRARIEHYAWLAPPPGIQAYAGHRRFARIDVVDYRVENREFDGAFQVPLRDIEDDQTGGYLLKARQLGEKARQFPGRAVLRTLAQGRTLTCFDGSPFFATSHQLGVGRNLLEFTASSGDNQRHQMILLIHRGPVLPMIWQNRKPFVLRDNADSREALLQKVVSFWVDGEGAAAFGYWWDAICVRILHTPSVAELVQMLMQAESELRSFRLPATGPGDEPEYIHEQLTLSPATCTFVCSTGLAPRLRQILVQDAVPDHQGQLVGNPYRGAAELLVSAFLNE
ncbi:MAG: Mu-like prophage major head subunit gpT family protein [Gemmatales bacterium]|nr:Mu-like prophage major head subunit gpT family protein [Gemmatales bacterium]MDW7993945.1 Mu-like prophage major head subunit gpT family protein [Gemmatales bacterium]